MLDSSFITPQYGAYCFADLPQTIVSLFSDSAPSALSLDTFSELPRRYETVILFYIDAFGWRFFERYCDQSPFLRRMMEGGAVSKLTAQFPSTTAAHVTTIHSGQAVGQSGVFEWHYYEPLLDAIFSPLLFSFSGDKKRETVAEVNIKPSKFFPLQTMYQTLKLEGVKSYVLQHRSYTPSTFSKVMLKGAKIVPFSTFPEGLVNLRHLLARQNGPAYYFLYFDPLDDICHRYGPDSSQLEAEIESFLHIIDRLFLRPLDGRRPKTLFIMTTDHGQTAVHPESTCYINRESHFSGFERFIRTNRKGQLLVPAGSPRDLFLYIREGAIEEAQAFLKNRLDGIAEVYTTQDLIAWGVFGPQPPSAAFLSRVGNLVVLPHERQTVWWYEKGRFEMKLRGHHGGLSREEMEIPLILYPLGEP